LGYDAASRIVTQKVNSAVRTNVYDKTDQLLSSSATYAYSATYDPVGNRQVANGRTYTPNSLNQYTSLTSPSQGLAYDVNGNLTNWAGTTYTHDSQGQLQYVGNYVAMSYDYRRLRVGESVLLDARICRRNGVRSLFSAFHALVT
jgi:hypothetical protein